MPVLVCLRRTMISNSPAGYRILVRYQQLEDSFPYHPLLLLFLVATFLLFCPPTLACNIALKWYLSAVYRGLGPPRRIPSPPLPR